MSSPRNLFIYALRFKKVDQRLSRYNVDLEYKIHHLQFRSKRASKPAHVCSLKDTSSYEKARYNSQGNNIHSTSCISK